jgi:hypothetical protein
MCATVLAFPVAETGIHCSDCGKGIDPDRQIAFECSVCGTWTCKNEACLCEHDQLALTVQRSLDRLNPSVWTRIQRWFNRRCR